jgi:alpha-aminoadipic semialdehyde synthase
MNKIGLRKEEKLFETRVAVVPEHVEKLNTEHNIEFVVEPSQQRAFSQTEYESAGAQILPLKTSGTPVVLGIKEMPLEFFEKDVAYLFFSHTIKGQKYNMPMLQCMIDSGATLLDYECVVDENERRLIFFGNWAGMAGISDTFRALGERLELEGLKPNPFANLTPTLDLKGLDGLREEFKGLGDRIRKQGLPEKLTPFVIGFAGYGNVSRGAQEIFDILPHKAVEPSSLANLKPEPHLVYKCVFKEEHMVEPKDAASKFELQHYYEMGSKAYEGIFERYIPYLTILMNCIYWTPDYPRLLTKDFIKKHWSRPDRKLRVIGDISCDIKGAIEFTLNCTNPGAPTIVYLVDEDRAERGIAGNGPVIMAVDNLPCELPRESSRSFSETLLRFIPVLSNTDFKASDFSELELPRELKNAVIVYRGKLTPDFEYLQEFLS